MTMTPLEPWIKTKIGLPKGQKLTRDALDEYQLCALRSVVDYARRRSPFYRSRLKAFPAEEIESLDALSALPFTTPADLRGDELRFLCVSQAEVERVVTLQTSGTTAHPKRLHFTADDLLRTVDFFHHGMSTMVKAGERVLILMPGELPGSVGALLVQGLERLGVEGIVHGLVNDPAEVLEKVDAFKINCLVGLPVQVLALARCSAPLRLPNEHLHSVLLSADYVPAAIVREVTSRWGVSVYNHYGMTEMGLGGGVECRHLSGYHLREADLLVEVVDPQSGVPLPDGDTGEVVFTTLTRRGMPLIRYRTGDRARFLTGPCPCGTVLRRLDRVRGRVSGDVVLAGGERFNIADLDEALFPLPFLLDYQVALDHGNGKDLLEITVATNGTGDSDAALAVRKALLTVPPLRRAVYAGTLLLEAPRTGAFSRTITIKRTVVDRRKELTC